MLMLIHTLIHLLTAPNKNTKGSQDRTKNNHYTIKDLSHSPPLPTQKTKGVICTNFIDVYTSMALVQAIPFVPHFAFPFPAIKSRIVPTIFYTHKQDTRQARDVIQTHNYTRPFS